MGHLTWELTRKTAASCYLWENSNKLFSAREKKKVLLLAERDSLNLLLNLLQGWELLPEASFRPENS